MKTFKVLLAVTLVAILASANSFSQTVQGNYTAPLFVALRCNGPVVEILQGTWSFHSLVHRNVDGNVVWVKHQGVCTDLMSASGEIYTITLIRKQEYPDGNTIIYDYHYNMMGNLGSHYLYRRIYKLDLETYQTTVLFEETRCI